MYNSADVARLMLSCEEARLGMRMKQSVAAVTFVATIVSSIFAADKPAAAETDSLQIALNETLAEATLAITQYGVTDSAMTRLQVALAELGARLSDKDHADLQQIHGSPKSNAAVLASRGEDSITIFLSRFEAGHATPIHDHQTWGVLYVLEGRDHYTSWDADFKEGDSSRATTRILRDTVLGPGNSIYWFPPPGDLHTQEAVSDTVWELVLAGRNFLSPMVLPHRHYFEPRTGEVSHTPPK